MLDPRPGQTLFDPACGTGGFLTSALAYMRRHHIRRPEDEDALAHAYTCWGASNRADIILTNPPFGGREEAGIENNFPAFSHPRNRRSISGPYHPPAQG